MKGEPLRIATSTWLWALGAGGAVGAIVLAGCGLGPGPGPAGVELTVTRNFGTRVVGTWSAPQVRGQESVLWLLKRDATVTVGHGGGLVESIDGLPGGQEAGEPVAWFYYVNGVQAPKGPARTTVHPGDHIWWDRHDSSQSDTVSAVVGSYPEPFLNGIEGERLPVRVECAVLSSKPCRTVTTRLRALGVPAALAAPGPGGEPESLHILVGPWAAVRAAQGAQTIERGPRLSGVYVRFSANGGTLTVLDEQGTAVRTLAAGAGLIAATRYAGEAPVWVVTGTDVTGLELAARAFDQATLENRFAVAFTPEGTALPAPARHEGY
jgi:Domain of unknown function (DUF4430)